MIRVVDDGMGMDRDDALLSLERHATSKIKSGHDLARIHTLGFRGEALPSIASVSRFRMSTRLHEGLEGTEIVVNGGKIDSVRASGEAPGHPNRGAFPVLQFAGSPKISPQRKHGSQSRPASDSRCKRLVIRTSALFRFAIRASCSRRRPRKRSPTASGIFADRSLFEQLLEISPETVERNHGFRFYRESRGEPVHESGTDPLCERSARGKYHDSTRLA